MRRRCSSVATIERYLGYFRKLLEAMVADDTQVVDRLPMLPRDERNRVLDEWNETASGVPSVKVHPRAVRAAGGENPEAVAVVYEAEN